MSTMDNRFDGYKEFKMDHSKDKIQYYIFQFLIEIFWLYGQRIKGIIGIVFPCTSHPPPSNVNSYCIQTDILTAITKILFELVYLYFVLL